MFDFDRFLDRMVRLSYTDILREADREAGSIERSTRKIRSVVQRRQSGGRGDVEKINAFLYFIRFKSRPSGATDSDFKKYRRVIEELVQRGELEPQVLRQFE
jgi:hypothetical protein